MVYIIVWWMLDTGGAIVVRYGIYVDVLIVVYGAMYLRWWYYVFALVEID